MPEGVRRDGTPKSTKRRSRRELLAGAAGVLGVIGAETLVKAAPAQAGTDGDVVLGVDQQSTSGITGVLSSSTTGLHGQSTGTGVRGEGDYAGVSGSGGSAGVIGMSSSGSGVYGDSDSADAVLGFTPGAGNGVRGWNNNTSGLGYGVFGNHTQGGYGVYGQTNSEGAAGVWGDNNSGAGVKGTSGYMGLYGHVTGAGGYGVWGVTTVDGATAVYADASGTNGTALDVNGPSSFLLSGLVSIASGAKSASVTGVSLRSASLVLATVQNNAGVSVAYAVPNVSLSKITINLNKVVPLGKTAKVAWFVVN